MDPKIQQLVIRNLGMGGLVSKVQEHLLTSEQCGILRNFEVNGEIGSLQRRYPFSEVSIGGTTGATIYIRQMYKTLLVNQYGGTVPWYVTVIHTGGTSSVVSAAPWYPNNVASEILGTLNADADAYSGSLTCILNRIFLGYNKYYKPRVIQRSTYNTDKLVGEAYSTPVAQFRDMGFTAPPSAPAISLSAGGLTGTYYWKFSYYYDNRLVQESNAGPYNGTTLSSQQATLTFIDTPPAGVSGRIIYRTKAGGGIYYYVGYTTASTYIDNTPDSSLGTEEAPNDNGVLPRGSIVESLNNRLFVAGHLDYPHILFFSSKEETTSGSLVHGADPEIFPSLYWEPIGNDMGAITGLIKLSESILLIFKTHSVYALYNADSDPDNFVFKHVADVGTVHGRTLKNKNGVVYGYMTYPEDGLYRFSESGWEKLSTPIELYHKDSNNRKLPLGDRAQQFIAFDDEDTHALWGDIWGDCYVLGGLGTGVGIFNILFLYNIMYNKWDVWTLPYVSGYNTPQACGLADYMGKLWIGYYWYNGVTWSYSRTLCYNPPDITNPATTDPWSAQVSIARSGWIDFGYPDRIKRIHAIYVTIDPYMPGSSTASQAQLTLSRYYDKNTTAANSTTFSVASGFARDSDTVITNSTNRIRTQKITCDAETDRGYLFQFQIAHAVGYEYYFHIISIVIEWSLEEPL